MAGNADTNASLTDTSSIKEWRSIITLIVFVLANLTVLFPFHMRIPFPRRLFNAILDTLSSWRVISPRQEPSYQSNIALVESGGGCGSRGDELPKSLLIWLNFPVNFITGPLVADLFLLAIQAIGREEVKGGTYGANNISPIDIMGFFLSLAYIALSIDASGLIRWLAFKVLQKGGKHGHLLFFYLYAFFFGLSTFVGNDPVILSGTAFLAYMTRVSSNIVHPRAWIHSQFAVANIASATLVSSNPTNLVLAGAFKVRFIDYTANMIVPVVATAIVLFPFLLFVIFSREGLIPRSIEMHQLPEELRLKAPINPNIPHARGVAEEREKQALLHDEEKRLMSLEEIMNPFLDRRGAVVGDIVMATALVTVLAVNAATNPSSEKPVSYVTLPAAFVMLCWDLWSGWVHREETRGIARQGWRDVERLRAERAVMERRTWRHIPDASGTGRQPATGKTDGDEEATPRTVGPGTTAIDEDLGDNFMRDTTPAASLSRIPSTLTQASRTSPNMKKVGEGRGAPGQSSQGDDGNEDSPTKTYVGNEEADEKKAAVVDGPGASVGAGADESLEQRVQDELARREQRRPATLVSVVKDKYLLWQSTFPTASTVLAHLPFALVPFAFCMFVLVQGLVTKGWVPVFAYGWDAWVKKTGTVGAVGGMGFVSVVLCNFSGTNIGTTILLSRVIQSWKAIHDLSGVAITERTFWATVYGMALGVNYGAFSAAFNASLAGLLWRDILARRHVHVRRLEFALVNMPIIAIAMAVGCSVLIGEVYITRKQTPFTGVIV